MYTMKHAALISEKKVADPSCQGSARGEVKAIQNSVSRGWASGTRRDPHPSTSDTVPGPYEHVLPRAAALDAPLRLGQRKGGFCLPERLHREGQLEQLSTSWRVGGRATFIAPNIASDADPKHDCIAGGVPWSRVRPRLC